MRRISLALALVGAFAVGCSGGNKAPSESTGVAKGVTGQYYYVNLFTPPMGGIVTSSIGGINCGASNLSVTAATPPQYAYTYYPGSNACGVNGQTQFQWAQTVTLTAVPQGGNAFLGWAGDCTGYAPCVLSAGSDKSVVAIFGQPGTGHPNFMNPATHSAAVGMLDCAACHGANLQGQGMAPSCSTTGCHSGTNAPPNRTGMGTNLVAAITSVTPATNTVTFTLRDAAGADVYVTGETGGNLPMPVTTAIVNFGTDGAGNALPYKNGATTAVAPFNPATVAAFAAITSMSITSGTLPSATAFTYPEGSLTRLGVACTLAAPCACAAAPNNCVYSGTVGYGFRTVAGALAYGACSVATPCTCSTANPCAPALPTVNGPGMLTFTGGVYTYTFAASPFPAAGSPLLANTHTAWLATYRRADTNPVTGYLGNGQYTAQNVQFNFDANTGAAVANVRDIVSNASCAKCHDGFKTETNTNTGEFHSGARISGPYCNICHYEGRGTSGFADSAAFVHRVHAGMELTKATSGTFTTGYQAKNPYTGVGPTRCGTGLETPPVAPCVATVLLPVSQYTFHGIAVTYPQDSRNCTECHDSASASKAGQYLTRPTIQACGSCHDQLAATFLPVGTAVTSANHTGGAGLLNSSCTGCHDAANIASHHQPVQPPAADACYLQNGVTGCNTNTNAGYIAAVGFVPPGADTITYEIQSVSTWLDGAIVRPQMVFRMLQNGVAVDFGTYAAGVKDELVTGYVGGPSIYWVWAVAQDGVAAPADFNASTSTWLKACWRAPGTSCNLTRDVVTGWYTVQNRAAVVASSAVMLTGGIGYSYNMNSALPLTQTNLAAFPVTPTNVENGTVNFGGGAVTCSVATPCVVPVGGLVVAAENVTQVAAGFTGRRVVVDNAKCNACHGQLGVEPTFHAGQRNDAPSCSWCHTPNRSSSQWSANAGSFVHGIHSAAKRTVGFNWHAACQMGATWNATTSQCERLGVAEGPSIYYPEVEYPGTIGNCTQCHVAGGFDFSLPASQAALPNLLWSTAATGTAAAGMSTSPYVTVGTVYGSAPSFSAATGAVTAGAATTLVSSPIAQACFGCHTSATAQAHIEGAGAIYQPRSAGFVQESCLDCHGTGMLFAIDQVHRLP
jgi:OmcA/MtrC family decaheme c-type cytochrome